MESMYHYTSVDAFKSIVEHSQLRFTRSEFLNDPNDCQVLISLIKEHIENNPMLVSYHLKLPEINALFSIAPLTQYIEFLQKKIHLYVLSLTSNDDEMAMWNYYGNGGVQFSLHIDTLVKSLASTLKDNQLIACAPVKYVSATDAVDNIELPVFKNFRLASPKSSNVFSDHRASLKKDKHRYDLYETTKLKDFIYTYINGYMHSLNTLNKAGTISTACSSEDIFEAIYNNTNTLDGQMIFKKDLTLYLLVLSALIKSDTYKYENEFRIVYFENSLHSHNVRYATHTLLSQKFIKPYIETEKLNMDFVRGLILSPLTRNIPLDSSLYLNIIREFSLPHLTYAGIDFKWSSHKVRW